MKMLLDGKALGLRVSFVQLEADDTEEGWVGCVQVRSSCCMEEVVIDVDGRSRTPICGGCRTRLSGEYPPYSPLASHTVSEAIYQEWVAGWLGIEEHLVTVIKKESKC